MVFEFIVGGLVFYSGFLVGWRVSAGKVPYPQRPFGGVGSWRKRRQT